MEEEKREKLMEGKREDSDDEMSDDIYDLVYDCGLIEGTDSI